MDITEFNRGKRLLPSWMMHNIERLHTYTDFEQYASSPPETESFIPEHAGESDIPSFEFSGHTNDHTPDTIHIPENTNQVSSSLSSTLQQGKRLANSCITLPKHPSVVDSIKFEDIIYSSPDVTPCATPESSPMPQRKISWKSEITVQANPKKWFYIDPTISKKFKDPRAVGIGSVNQKEINIKPFKNEHDNKKGRGSCNSHPNSTIKLAISNFDINAISPSSW